MGGTDPPSALYLEPPPANDPGIVHRFPAAPRARPIDSPCLRQPSVAPAPPALCKAPAGLGRPQRLERRAGLPRWAARIGRLASQLRWREQPAADRPPSGAPRLFRLRRARLSRTLRTGPGPELGQHCAPLALRQRARRGGCWSCKAAHEEVEKERRGRPSPLLGSQLFAPRVGLAPATANPTLVAKDAAPLTPLKFRSWCPFDAM